MTLGKGEVTASLKMEVLDSTVWRIRFGRLCGPVVRQTDRQTDCGLNESWRQFSAFLYVSKQLLFISCHSN